jgi:hypothetical protein
MLLYTIQAEECMSSKRRIAFGSCLLGMILLGSGCVIEPQGYHEAYHEGYYDRDHHRFYHDHAWHECVEHDEHCR